jgi:SET domain
MGAYAVAREPKSMLIGEYMGEFINQDEQERRGRVYDDLKYSCLFNITERYAVDSTRLGSKLKYCNHSSTPNCEHRFMQVSGDVRVGIYSRREIIPFEEVYFVYGYNSGPAWAMRGKLAMSGDERAEAHFESKKRKRSMMKDNPPVRTVASHDVSLPQTRAQSKRHKLRTSKDRLARRTSGRLASHLADAIRNTQPRAGACTLRCRSPLPPQTVDTDKSDESSANDRIHQGDRVKKRRATQITKASASSDSDDIELVMIKSKMRNDLNRKRSPDSCFAPLMSHH